MVGAPKKTAATYQDVLNAPEHLHAEIIDGDLRLSSLHRGDVKVRAEPFDAIELDLSVLWANIASPPQPSRAGEAAVAYVL